MTLPLTTARPGLPLAEVRTPGPRLRRHRTMAALVAGYPLAAAVAAALGDRLPLPTWLALHLLVLGAATNAVFFWTRHFAQALLHALPGGDRAAAARLAVLNAGILGVLTGVPAQAPFLVAGGAALVIGAVVGHGWSLVAMSRRCLLPGRLAGCVRYYVASAVALAVGAGLGGALGTGAAHAEGLHLAHAHANLLGWLGLAVLGTLFMLWPAVLRTRMDEDAPQTARRVLLLVAGGLLVAVAALVLLPPTAGARVAAVGTAAYLAGVAWSLRPFVATARRRAPHTAASWTLAAATTWFVVALALDVVALARSPQAAAAALDVVVPLLALGLVAQALVGAMTFLLPVTIGGGPAGNKRVAAVLETGWVARLVLTNVGLLSAVLGGAGSHERRAGLVLAVVALASTAPLVVAAVLVSRRAAAPAGAGTRTPPARDWTDHLAVGAVLTVVATIALVAGPAGAVPVVAAGDRVVDVVLTDFAVTPSRVEVPAGTRVLLRVRNDGAVRHDLRFGGGAATPLLATGQATELDLGVVTEQRDGWCTVSGHRAAGMTMTVAVGETPAPTGDPGAAPAPDWQPYDPRLAPAPGGTEHRITLRAQETDVAVADGVTQRMWTFGGTVPGPALRGKIGDLFVVTLVNDGTIAHSLDFHASAVAPDRLMRPVPPGGSIEYAFRAERAGAWLYHCSVGPMIQHVAMGMYGAVVVDPPDLAPVDEELILVQSELWLGEDGELPEVERMTAAEEDLVVFNGYADQYVAAPVHVAAGDRVRIWVVTAGPSQSSAFHVVGTQFDTVYEEGRYALRPGDPGGAQVLDVPPGAGGFVELVVPEAGTYPMVTHRLADAARGATGLLVADRH